MDPVLKQSLADFGQVMKCFTLFACVSQDHFKLTEKCVSYLLSSFNVFLRAVRGREHAQVRSEGATDCRRGIGGSHLARRGHPGHQLLKGSPQRTVCVACRHYRCRHAHQTIQI